MSKTLVTPDCIKHVLADESELDHLGEKLGFDKALMGNLRQLCSFDGRLKLGEGRVKKGKAGNCQLFDDVRWLQRKGSSTVEPAVGSNQHVYNSVPGLSASMAPGSLDTLLRPSKPLGVWVGEWKKVKAPAAALRLPSGSSLRGLSSDDAPPSLARQVSEIGRPAIERCCWSLSR